MTLEENTSEQSRQHEHEGMSGEPADDTVQKNTSNGLLMDYGQLSEAGDAEPAVENPGTNVGLTGGQGKDDEGGLDISQYTGPGSKSSTQIDDPEAPFKTGPGNGLSQGENITGADWENPEPENDSF